MGEQPSGRAGITAFVLGIVSWLLFLGTYPAGGTSFGDAVYYEPVTVLGPLVLPVVAIVFGHVGVRRAVSKGRGLAAAALVLGYLAFAFGAARFVGLAAAS
ncbi:hypothetical protein [Amycolatopsis sp. GA6-003]|uniref:hypothetical protein n=1 Tax=Amycolatopsis sp. GA6-003 TaxID=2652444 RepID=UPI0039174A62